MGNKSAKFDACAVLTPFSQWHVEGLLSKRTALKVNVTGLEYILSAGARPYIFQPGNFTGWGGEEVKASPVWISSG